MNTMILVVCLIIFAAVFINTRFYNTYGDLIVDGNRRLCFTFRANGSTRDLSCRCEFTYIRSYLLVLGCPFLLAEARETISFGVRSRASIAMDTADDF